MKQHSFSVLLNLEVHVVVLCLCKLESHTYIKDTNLGRSWFLLSKIFSYNTSNNKYANEALVKLK